MTERNPLLLLRSLGRWEKLIPVKSVGPEPVGIIPWGGGEVVRTQRINKALSHCPRFPMLRLSFEYNTTKKLITVNWNARMLVKTNPFGPEPTSFVLWKRIVRFCSLCMNHMLCGCCLNNVDSVDRAGSGANGGKITVDSIETAKRLPLLALRYST